MPRPPRFLLSKSYYHIITRGNNRNKIFRDEEDYQYYLDLISKYKKDLPFNLFHYCLMPNHVHLLIQTNDKNDFSLFMKKINLSYFHFYRKQYGWVGHFWQDRFKSQAIGKDEYFIQCGKYIELNPVRANIVIDPKEYPYSSYNYYSCGKNNELITRDFFYEGMGKNEEEKQNKYKDLVISDIIVSNYKKSVWGSDRQRYNETKKISYHKKFVF